MSKVVKGIVIGAIIGIATGGLGFAFGLTAQGVGLAAAIKTAAIYGAISGGLGAVAQSFVKKPSMDMGSVIDRQNLTINPQALGKWVFGETPCAMDIIYTEKVGDDVIIHVVASAAHEIDSFGDFYINDEKITFTGANADGDWFGALQKYNALGTQPQTGITIASSSWDGDGSGVAHIGLRWDFGNDDKEKLQGGIPTRITQVVKGSKVYDPRKDTTRGGSGSHRANDQSTWEWSDNWALIVAHYLLGYKNNDKLVYGVGINPDDIDWLQVTAMANVCDETVDSKPRYRVGGVMPTSNSHAQIISQLEAAVGGKVSKVGGKYYIWCPHDDLISAGTITNKEIVREIGVAFQPTGNIQDLYNTVRGRFIDPATLYQPTPYSDITEATAVTDDGRVRLMEQDFAIIQDESIAQRVAREMVRRTRFSATWSIAMGPEGMLYQPFDIVTLNCDETDNQNQLCRIISMDYSPAGVVGMTLLEEDASIYDTTVPLGTPITQRDPDSYDPTEVIPVTGLAATAISVTGSGGTVSDAFSVSWDDPGGLVRDTEVRYRVQGTTDYSYVQATGFVSAIITPVEPNTTYDIEARHITITGVKSPWEAITQTSTNTARGRSITASVSYTISNIWLYDGSAYNPSTLTNSALVEFKRGSDVIASRTIDATLSSSTNVITVDENAATSGEATTATVTGNSTDAVIIRVEHDDSGVEAVAEFLVLIAITDLTDLENDLDTLENVTLPALQNDIDNILPITETKISNDAITAPKIAANAIIAGKIAADAVTTNTIETGAITSLKIGAGEIKAINIEAGAVTANKINVANLQAISTSTGTLTSNLIRTAASGERLELTDVGTDATYAIWIGDSTKNDSNGVFWVKHNGSAKIDKTVFDIPTGGVITGAFSNASLATGGTTNTLTATSTAIVVGSGGIKLDVNLFYQALSQVVQVSRDDCSGLPNISGDVRIIRDTNSSFTSPTIVNTISFTALGVNDYTPDNDPSLTPGVCISQIAWDNTKSFVDSPSAGTYYYRALYSSWNSTFPLADVDENVIYVTYTVGE